MPTSTTTTVTSGQNPSRTGFGVTFTATVAPSAATGTVQFMDGAGALGSAAAMTAGVATLTTAGLTQATHSITGVYSGDGSYSTSTSAAVSQVVTTVANPTAINTDQSTTNPQMQHFSSNAFL